MLARIGTHGTRMVSRAFGASKATYDYKDPLKFTTLLTEDERMIMEQANVFAQGYLQPQVIETNRHEKFNPEIYLEMGKAGFLGCMTDFGGNEKISLTAYGLINREVERVDSSFRSMLSVQNSLVIFPISEYGTEAAKNKYLPKLMTGEHIGAFGLTEPDHGSDPGGMKTRAVKKGDKWILNGSKLWITSSPVAHTFVVWAKTPEGKLMGFILERGMKGLETPEIKGKFSLRSSITGGIMMSDVEVPESNVLQVSGYKGPFSCLNKARFGISWGVMGAAEDCFHRTLEYTKNRKQFDAPLAAFQLIQHKFAVMQTDIALGTQAVLQVSRQMEDGTHFVPEMISMVKRNNCMKAIEIARVCRDMHGGNGIVDEYHIIRHMTNLESVNTYEGTNDIHALILGRAITGIAAFSRALNAE
jgi:glutaryl-CoA dehydrogenase